MNGIDERAAEIEKELNSKVMDIAQVAAYIGVSEDIVFNLVKHDKLMPIYEGADLFLIREVVGFSLGRVQETFTKKQDRPVDRVDDTALSYLHNLALDVSEEEFEMAIAQHGEGSVYWYEKRKCYQAAFYINMPDGSKQRKVVSGATEYEAIGKMQAVKSGVAGGNLIVVNAAPPVPPVVVRTFAEVAAEYMSQCRHPNSDVTFVHKESLLKNHILPYFGNVDIKSIKAKEVQQFLQKVSRKASGELSSQAQIKNNNSTLKAILNYAYDNEYIDRVPNRGIVMPKGKATDKNSKLLDEEELVEVFRASMESIKYLTLSVVALGTGMRSEEFLALRWENIDFEAMCIHVEQAMIKQLNDAPGAKTKWKRALGDTKTDSSARTIRVGDVVLNQLAAWKQHMEDSGVIAAARQKGNEGFVFLDRSGNPQQYDHVSRNYTMYLKRRGLEELNVTFHKFRHSYATWARAKGGDKMVVKVFLGHSLKDDITDSVYTSMTDELSDGTTNIINDFVRTIWDRAHALGAISDPRGRNGKCKHSSKW